MTETTTVDHRRAARLARPLRAGVHDAAGLGLGVVPLGFALGAALAETAAPALAAWLGAPLLVAGSAHLVLVTEMDTGAPLLGAALAALLINSRFVVYGAALGMRFTQQPMWFRLLGAHLIVDQTYGLMAARVHADASPSWFRHYYLGAATSLWFAWSASVGVGLVVGPSVADTLPLEAVLSVMFMAMLAPQLDAWPTLLAAVVGGTAMASGLPSIVALALAAVSAGAVGNLTTGSDR